MLRAARVLVMTPVIAAGGALIVFLVGTACAVGTAWQRSLAPQPVDDLVIQERGARP